MPPAARPRFPFSPPFPPPSFLRGRLASPRVGPPCQRDRPAQCPSFFFFSIIKVRSRAVTRLRVAPWQKKTMILFSPPFPPPPLFSRCTPSAADQQRDRNLEGVQTAYTLLFFPSQRPDRRPQTVPTKTRVGRFLLSRDDSFPPPPLPFFLPLPSWLIRTDGC